MHGGHEAPPRGECVLLAARPRTRALVVRAQQRLAVGVDLPHVGQGGEEGLANLLALQGEGNGRADTLGWQAGRAESSCRRQA